MSSISRFASASLARAAAPVRDRRRVEAVDAELILASDWAAGRREAPAVEPAGRISVVVVAVTPALPVSAPAPARPAVSTLAGVDSLAQHRRCLDAYAQVRDLRIMKGTRFAARA